MIPKFRAWEESAEEGLQMWSWKEMCEIGLGQLFNNPKYELMQSTGLKDKNGVEIYESDIVVNHVGDVWIITYFRGAFRHYPVESFSKEKEKWFETDNIGNFGTEAFEVIGNIYENPDLLEVAE